MLRGEGLVWLIGWWYVCSLQTAGPAVRWCGQWMAALCCGIIKRMPISWHFQDCKARLDTNLTHVRRAIASTRFFFAY